MIRLSCDITIAVIIWLLLSFVVIILYRDDQCIPGHISSTDGENQEVQKAFFKVQFEALLQLNKICPILLNSNFYQKVDETWI